MNIFFEGNKQVSFVLALMLILSFVLANEAVFAQDDKDIQNSITSIQKKLDKEQAAKAALELQLSKIQGSVNATQQEILKTQAAIKTTQETIARKESEIAALEKKNNFQKIVLTDIIREMYYAKKTSAVDVVVSGDDFSGILGNIDHALSLEQKIFEMIDEIKGTQEQVSNDKEELAVIKEEHEKTLEVKQDIKQDLVADKIETQGDIAEKSATIAELQNKLAELRSALSGYLGKEYSTKDIDDAVKFASKATGIRKEFLQAELIVETGYGTFTGGCTYKNIRMKKADVTEFLKIAAELEKAYGGNYKNKKLSCSPKWGGYGGAMGVAQFMPTTWIGYKSKISAKTGSNPADPWDLADGITGMAIKLAAGGATSKKGEYNASKIYYCGGPGSSFWKTKCEDYAKKVQYFSKDPESHI